MRARDNLRHLALPLDSPMLLRNFLRLAVLGIFAGITAEPLLAQELREQPIPFSVWLDFKALSRPDPPRVGLPIWLESLQSQHDPATVNAPEQTVYRLRLRRLGPLNQEIRLRLFFEDREGASPVVTGWTETGTQRYDSEALGSGLNLPSSAELTIPVTQTDYLDITVPGDGTNLRGVFLNTLKKTEGALCG